jgi:hypothetical protein
MRANEKVGGHPCTLATALPVSPPRGAGVGQDHSRGGSQLEACVGAGQTGELRFAERDRLENN